MLYGDTQQFVFDCAISFHLKPASGDDASQPGFLTLLYSEQEKPVEMKKEI